MAQYNGEPSKITDETTKILGSSSSGESSFVRVMRFHVPDGDPVRLITTPGMLPQIGSAHPNHSKFICRAIGPSEYEGEDVYRVEVTYRYTASNLKISMGRGGSNVYEYNEETPPWDLPPQNFRESFIDMEIPVTEWYEFYGNKYELVSFENTAKQKFEETTTVQIQVLEFDVNFKNEVAKSKMARGYIINSGAEEVCGINIGKHQGKLLPMSRNHYVVYESNTSGNVKWEYDTVHVTIHILPLEHGWEHRVLNVGNQVLWKKENEKYVLGGVFRYNKLVKATDTILTTETVFGDISEVIEQRSVYIKNGGKPENFNYEQLEGPFPLDRNGCLDVDGLKTGGYIKLAGFFTKPESWAQYDLPKEL
jgi:hypothetical protein